MHQQRTENRIDLISTVPQCDSRRLYPSFPTSWKSSLDCEIQHARQCSMPLKPSKHTVPSSSTENNQIHRNVAECAPEGMVHQAVLRSSQAKLSDPSQKTFTSLNYTFSSQKPQFKKRQMRRHYNCDIKDCDSPEPMKTNASTKSRYIKTKFTKSSRKHNHNKHQTYQERSQRNALNIEIVRRYLTTDVVLSAVHALHQDRIRPLLADVYQRIKHEARQILTETDQDRTPQLQPDHDISLSHFSSPDLHSLSNQVDTSYIENDPRLLSRKGSVNVKEWQTYLDTLDVYILFLFIRSVCHDQLFIDLTDATLSPSSRALLAQTCDLHFFDSQFSTIPELVPFLSQLDVQLVHQPTNYLPWIDLHDTNNPYGDLAWRSFGAFLTSKLVAPVGTICDDSNLLPSHFKGGRYGLALELKKAEYPALRALSLGELCHIVQLAIHGRLLAYEHSVLKPVASCIDLSGTFLRRETANFPEFTNQDRQTDANDFSRHKLVQKQNSNCSSSMGSIEYELYRSYETVMEFAADLDELLISKPGGLVTAQLKKAMLKDYKRIINPQIFGYKKLTDFLTADPIIIKICQILSLNPLSDCLLMIHREYLNSPANYKNHKLLSNNITPNDSLETTSASSPTTTNTSLTNSHLDSPAKFPKQQKSKVEIPDLTLKPASSVMSITFYAWALSNKSCSTEPSDLTNTSCQPQQQYASLKNDDDEDGEFLLKAIYNAIQTHGGVDIDQMSVPPHLLSTIYGSYWDCFIPSAARASDV